MIWYIEYFILVNLFLLVYVLEAVKTKVVLFYIVFSAVHFFLLLFGPVKSSILVDQKKMAALLFLFAPEPAYGSKDYPQRIFSHDPPKRKAPVFLKVVLRWDSLPGTHGDEWMFTIAYIFMISEKFRDKNDIVKRNCEVCEYGS